VLAANRAGIFEFTHGYTKTFHIRAQSAMRFFQF